MASAPKRASNVTRIPFRSLQIADIAGQTDEAIGLEHGFAPRTVRRRRTQARALFPGWPHCRITDDPTPDRQSTQEQDPRASLLELPGDPDEIETLAGRILLTAAVLGGPGSEARGANAVRLLEFARDRRARGVGTGSTRSPEEIADAAKRAILSATENVQQRD